jgi:protein arginine phosphatase
LSLGTRWQKLFASPMHWPARLLHPFRRRDALTRLARHGWPRSVVFVCHGNVCRSPYAAAAFVRRLPPALRRAVRVDSAGFRGPGRPAPPHAVVVARRHGVDLTTHRSKPVSPGDGRNSELVVVMDPWQRRALRSLGHDEGTIVVLGDLDPGSIATRAIVDPIDQPEAAFEASYSRIDRCVSALARALGSSARAP